ncbi:GNAT family N-acetyltransferase [Dietzia cercidiphylli]|uniref:GNAT family N-acetyltransferase n=1 Tax=Dietzia cercidiphylli TaxID=498199 RepID=UPI00223BCA18|nr:GNAT family N-acetyltransferase [Dietzia cercidiphylli]MCT1515563.1 GNAT family N-acetyltransferase [Dietzia cercidiphylli]
MSVAGGSLLDGPYGRALCAAVAEAAAPGTDWWRLTAQQRIDAFGTVRAERVRALGEPRILGELSAGLWKAVYWQDPEDDREDLARPGMVAALRPIARALSQNPATKWWSSRVDRAGQNIVQLLLDNWVPVNRLEDARPQLGTWRDQIRERERAGTEDPGWRSTTGRWWTAPVFAGIAWTSRSRESVGPLAPHTTEDHMGWSRARVHPVEVEPSARIREIDSPQDWASLVNEFPLEVTQEKRGDWWRTTGRDGSWWIPDWAEVAESYDAVHVTVTGYLRTAGRAIDTAQGATVLAGWGPDHTCWLRPDRLRYTGVVEQWHRPYGTGPPDDILWRKVPADSADGSVRVRPLSADDDSLLEEATLLNVNWTGEDRVAAADVADDPALAHYSALRPDRGDFGLVAEVSGRPVGVVWLLFLDASDPGFGYVEDGVPELSVCVWPGFRGRGLGALLLEAALAAARDRGLELVSLSVERGNPARRLYTDMGFVAAEGAASETMVIRLSK